MIEYYRNDEDVMRSKMGLMKYADTFVSPPDDPAFAEANVTEFISEYSGKTIHMTTPSARRPRERRRARRRPSYATSA